MEFLRKLFASQAPQASATRPAAVPPVLPQDATDAIDDALRTRLNDIYPKSKQHFLGANTHFEDGGPDPLSGVSIFYNERPQHWHYVSWGLSRFGTLSELTFRVGAPPGALSAKDAPVWPVPVLNMLARRILRTRRNFEHGHWWQGPPGMRPEFLAFARDPALGRVTTPHGSITYLQALAVDADVIEEMKREENEGRGSDKLAQILALNPYFISSNPPPP